MAQSKGDRPEKKRKSAAAKAAPKPASRGADDELLADLRAAVYLVERAGGGATKGSRKRATSQGASTKPPDRPPLDDTCIKLIELVRRRCPGLLPAEPLDPGAVAAPVPLQPKEAAGLMTIAARQAVLMAIGARVPSDARQLPAAVLWQDGPDALLVELAGIDVQIADGLVSVAIPLRCDQLPKGRDLVVVDLVLGTPDRPTGMLAAASRSSSRGGARRSLRWRGRPCSIWRAGWPLPPAPITMALC